MNPTQQQCCNKSLCYFNGNNSTKFLTPVSFHDGVLRFDQLQYNVAVRNLPQLRETRHDASVHWHFKLHHPSANKANHDSDIMQIKMDISDGTYHLWPNPCVQLSMTFAVLYLNKTSRQTSSYTSFWFTVVLSFKAYVKPWCTLTGCTFNLINIF